MKKVFLGFALALLLVPVFAQDAGTLTDILGKKTATLMDFSYLVVSELGMSCSPFEAYTYCDRFGTFPITALAKEPVTMKDISFFLMSNYDQKGGVMWKAARSPRYAWKEMKASGFWKKGSDPDSTLSGRDLVRYVSKFFSTRPDAKLANPPTGEASEKYRDALLANKENAL
jgi:hypothetical protein